MFTPLQFPPALAARMVFLINVLTVPSGTTSVIPPPGPFPVIALLLTFRRPKLTSAPPTLAEKLLLMTVAVPILTIPPPFPPIAVLRENVLPVTVSAPAFKIPPPPVLGRAVALLENVLLITAREPKF
jgi:hypothetical protein